MVALAAKHAQKAQATQASSGKLLLEGYSEIKPANVDWLWQDRIALGKLTIISGDPGLGKSYLSLSIAATVSTGAKFPDGAPCCQGEVIVATCEDGPADTIRPRLDCMGADVSKVYHLHGVEDGKKVQILQLDRHIDALRECLETHPEVRLIIVDPISAFMGDTDSHKNAEVRTVLGPLATLAEQHNVAVVGINHLSKAQGRALYRSMGSLAFVAAARAAWAVMADPDDDERRLFLLLKNNLANPSGLAFRIENGAVVFENTPVLISVDDLDPDETPREEARSWLKATLSEPIAASKVLKSAKVDGISERTLRRAKKEMKVESVQFAGEWVWALPSDEEGADDAQAPYTF